MDGVGVYKTNVQKRSEANRIINILKEQFPGSSAHFDLEDCDKVLRVTGLGNELNSGTIRGFVHSHGYMIEELPIRF